MTMGKTKQQFEKLVEQYGQHFIDERYVDIDYDYDYDSHNYDDKIKQLKNKLSRK